MRAFHRRSNRHHVDFPRDGEVHCGTNEELREHDMRFTAVSVSNPPTTAPVRLPPKPFVAPDAPAPAKLPPLPAPDRLRPCNPMHVEAPHAPNALCTGTARRRLPLARPPPLPALPRVSYLPPSPPLPPSARLHRANKHALIARLYCTLPFAPPALCPSASPFPRVSVCVSSTSKSKPRKRMLPRCAALTKPRKYPQHPCIEPLLSQWCGHPRKLL